MKTKKQKDALLVYEQISSIKERGKSELIETYGRAVNRFPILIRQNGLQQTIGFYVGKSKGESSNAEGAFLDHIKAILEVDDLHQAVLQASLQDYMLFTRRCLELSIWYRRFTESILKVDSTGCSSEKNSDEQRGV